MAYSDLLFYSYTYILIVCYLIISGLFAICAACFLFFSPFNAENFSLAAAILITSLLIFVIIGLSKILFGFMHKICQAKTSTWTRNQIVCGLSGILICTILPRIFVYFVEINAVFALPSIYLPCATSIAIYYHFVYECDQRYKWDYFNRNKKPYWIIGVLHALLLIVTVKIAMTYFHSDEKTIGTIVLYQVASTMFSFPTIFDLYGVLSGQRKY